MNTPQSSIAPSTEPAPMSDLATIAPYSLAPTFVDDATPARQQAFDRLAYIFRRAGTETTMQSLFGAVYSMRAEPQEDD